MNDTTDWISPSAAADMVFDVRTPGVEGLDLALLRPRSKGAERSLAMLIGAKLQPMRPGGDAWTTLCGWPVTARDHRLILAQGAPDPGSLSALVAAYDAAARPQQRLIAAVLTVRFDADQPVHAAMTAACAFATFNISRQRRLTSLVVLHTPCLELAEAAVHTHTVIFARSHRQSGWQSVHPDLNDRAHEMWADEWAAFRRVWDEELPVL